VTPSSLKFFVLFVISESLNLPVCTPLPTSLKAGCRNQIRGNKGNEYIIKKSIARLKLKKAKLSDPRWRGD
jgi:hypothetical protein